MSVHYEPDTTLGTDDKRKENSSFLGVYSRALSLQNVTHGASSLAAPGSWLGTEFTFHLRCPDSESALPGGSLIDLCAQSPTGTAGDSPGQRSAVWGRQSGSRLDLLLLSFVNVSLSVIWE